MIPGSRSALFGAEAGLPKAYTTLDPAKKHAYVTLSNGNLTATTTNDDGWGKCALSVIGKSSGKWYWELTVSAIGGAACHGAATSSINLATFVGNDIYGWGYYSYDGHKKHNGDTAYGASYTTGDVIGVALDMDTGTLTFYKNGVSQGQAFTGLSGTIYAAVSPFWYGGSAGSVVCNFGATAFAYSVPGGYNAGLYTQ